MPGDADPLEALTTALTAALEGVLGRQPASASSSAQRNHLQYRGDKLIDGNYREWAYNMKEHLALHDLLGVVDGSEGRPADATGRASFDKRAGSAVHVLRLAVDFNTQQVHINGKDNATEIWTALKAAHQRSALSHSAAIQRELQQMKLHPGDDVRAFVNMMFELSIRLAECDDDLALSPVQLGRLLLVALDPVEWGATLQILNGTAKATLTFDYIKKMLIDNLASTEAPESSTSGSGAGTALFVRAATMAGQQQETDEHSFTYADEPKCNKCGQSGHIAIGCRRRLSAQRDTVSIHPNVGQTGGGSDGRGRAGNRVRRRGGRGRGGGGPAQGGGAQARVANASDYAFRASAIPAITLTSNQWILDSGATAHMSPHSGHMIDYKPFASRAHLVQLGDGTVIEAKGVGDVRVQMLVGSVRLKYVLYVPMLSQNLLSVPKLTDKGYEVRLRKDSGTIMFGSKEFDRAERVGDSFIMNMPYIETANSAKLTKQASMELWHDRLAHISMDTIEKMLKGDAVLSMSPELRLPNTCGGCAKGKMTRRPFGQRSERASASLDLIHADLCGPTTCPSLGGSFYFAVLVDDCTTFTTLLFLKQKGEFAEKFIKYANLVETQFGRRIKCLRTDNGGEFKARALIDFCNAKGTRLERSTPYTPQQNGVAERKNRTILEYALSMLHAAHCSPRLWAQAVHTAGCVFNRTINTATGDKTPFELWHGRKPDLTGMRVFGCKAYVQVPRILRKKLEAKAKDAIFCGYPIGVKGWNFVDPETSIVYYSRVARFVEDEFPGHDALINLTKPSKSQFYELELEDDDDDGLMGLPDPPAVALQPQVAADDPEHRPPDVVQFGGAVLPHGAPAAHATVPQVPDLHAPAPPDEPAVAPGVASTLQETFQRQVDQLGPKRQRTSTKHYQAFVAQCVNSDICEPYTIQEAWDGPHGELWHEATDAEIASLQRTDTYVVVDLPPGAKTVGTKFVFALKRNELGEMTRRKARLVAQGFSQRPGVDYSETYSPVVQRPALRAMFVMAVNYNLEMHAMDFTTAFLNGDIDADVYVRQPPGYVDPERPNALWKLKRSRSRWRSRVLKSCEKILRLKRYDVDTALVLRD
jgi:hypothetical protein